jgi:hypothetical protein
LSCSLAISLFLYIADRVCAWSVQHCPGAKTGHVLEESGCVWDAMLNQTNIGQNNNKYYIIQLIAADSGASYWLWTRYTLSLPPPSRAPALSLSCSLALALAAAALMSTPVPVCCAVQMGSRRSGRSECVSVVRLQFGGCQVGIQIEIPRKDQKRLGSSRFVRLAFGQIHTARTRHLCL